MSITSTGTNEPLAIHNCRTGFTLRWIDYCRANEIPYKLVDCYANDIVRDLESCCALLWHYSQSEPRDILVAHKILSALEHSGFVIFPDFRTAWHFDDKIGQKYLFEALEIPTPNTYVFVQREDALKWARGAEYPKVCKSRHGSGSSNVNLVTSSQQARRLIRRAFGRGRRVYQPWQNLKERFYKWRLGDLNVLHLVKGVARFVYPPRFARVIGRECGYVLFQDFVPDNDSDVRVIVIDGKAFAIRRWVRARDFRASGSGKFSVEPASVDQDCIELAFEIVQKIGSSCAAFDFIRKADGSLVLLEVSYGFNAPVYEKCPGYWDVDMNWHAGPFNPQGWIIELVMKQAYEKDFEVRDIQ